MYRLVEGKGDSKLIASGISIKDGTTVTGFLIKDRDSERLFIIPESCVTVKGDNIKIGKAVEVTILSDQEETPFYDICGNRIKINDLIETKDGEVGTVNFDTKTNILSVVFHDQMGTPCRTAPLFCCDIEHNGYQVIGNHYSGRTSNYRDGYCRY